MYTLFSHGRMIADKVRMQAYLEAIRRTVKPGDVVLDLGAGTGVFALVACQCGARRVFAVEPDDVIHVTRQLARDNGFADRITCYQAMSTSLESLPEPVDVVISDLRGALPLFGHHLPSIIDVRERFLAPGGALIPTRDVLWAAITEAPDLRAKHVEPWDKNGLGLDMRGARKLALNARQAVQLEREHLLVEGRSWATLDYRSLTGPNASGTVAWTAERPGRADGVALWFEGQIADGLGFSNGPGQPDIIYSGTFFPLVTPIDVLVGDLIELELHADLVGDDYLWRWRTRVERDGRQVASLSQSTFHGAPISPERLRRRASSHRPTAGIEAEIDALVLEHMDGDHSLGQLAEMLCERFPDMFPTLPGAMARVGRLVEKYAR